MSGFCGAKQAKIVVPNWEKRKKALRQRENAPQKEQKRRVKGAKQAIRHYSKEKAGFRSGKRSLINKKRILSDTLKTFCEVLHIFLCA